MDENSTAGVLVDAEITTQVIPPDALARAKQLYRDSHGQLHRGHFADAFALYTEGLAAGMEVHLESLREFIAEL